MSSNYLLGACVYYSGPLTSFENVVVRCLYVLAKRCWRKKPSRFFSACSTAVKKKVLVSIPPLLFFVLEHQPKVRLGNTARTATLPECRDRQSPQPTHWCAHAPNTEEVYALLQTGHTSALLDSRRWLQKVWLRLVSKRLSTDSYAVPCFVPK